MTIYEIKYRVQQNAPHFFDRAALRFFGQTMRDFSVKKVSGGYIIAAPMKHNGRVVGETRRFFNPLTNSLEMVREEMSAQ